MLGRTYDAQICSAARALEQVGERWSLLIIRDALFADVTRFREFQRRLGVAPNILKRRLDRFVEDGVMEMRPYSRSEQLHEYVLTEKGRELRPVIIALTTWGDHWLAPEGPPIIYTHAECGGDTVQLTSCTRCDEARSNLDVSTRPGSRASWQTPAAAVASAAVGEAY
jgi:DNA-binding HxlR family transcriptional regulator